MARIRSIKLDLFMDDGLAEVSLEAHFLLAGLPCLADSEGRLEDRPRRIQAQIFPYRSGVDVDACLDELARTGHIRRYAAADGGRYLQVENWDEDQRPHIKEPPSSIPSAMDSTEHLPSTGKKVSSPGTRQELARESRGKNAGILGMGSGVLGVGSGDLPPPPSAARQDSFLPGPDLKPARKAKEAKKPADPRHAPLTQELCEQLGWPHHGGRTAKAISQLLELAAQGGHREDAGYHEVVRRAAIARVHVGFPTVRELHELVTHWGHFAEPQRRGTGPPDGLEATPPDTCAGCGRRGQGGGVGNPEIWLGYECGCLPAFAEAQSGGLHFTKAAEWAAQRRAV